MTEHATRTRVVVATVLLVDDEERVTEGLEAILHSEPYQVFVAHSAMEALALLRRRAVDVVVSDERMPGMSGSKFLSVVSKEFPDTARIILTGHATIEAAVVAINEGRICCLLQKPCKPVDLRSAIARALHTTAVTRTARQLLEIARSENRRLDPFAEARSDEHDPAATQVGSGLDCGGFSHEEMTRLSRREREVFGLLVDGLRVGQVAKALFVSEHTVRNHLKSIFDKLDVHSQVELLGKGRGLASP
jgi:two-component system probable response regulator PhcQ